MNRKPIFETTAEDDGEGLKFLEDLYTATEHYSDINGKPHEVCYFPGSILKMTLNGNTLIVLWDEYLDEGCWKSCFEAAFTDCGKDITVEHANMEDLDDRDPYSQI